MSIGEANAPDDAPEQLAHLIDFTRAEVVSPMIYPPKPTLVVAGEKPYASMEVTLVPLTYVSQPPYWGIQVVGSPTERGPHVEPLITSVPYTVQLDLAGVTGSSGVEVIGANTTAQMAVPTEVSEPESA
jgi:hypothetical protein